MTSMKTHNTFTPSILDKEKNTFFVSDSIKHLVNEETFAKNNSNVSDPVVVRGDITAKVYNCQGQFVYCSVATYVPHQSICIDGPAQLFKDFHENKNCKIEILLKNEDINLNLNCIFLQFDEISPGVYIYTLGIND